MGLDSAKINDNYKKRVEHITSKKDNKKDLLTENKRLKEQLDREIHINRKMKRALEEYADLKNWRCDTITGFQSVWQGGVDDEQTGKIMSKKDFEKIYLSMLNLKIGNNRRLSPQETKDYIAMTEPKEMTDKEYYEMKIKEE